MEFYRYEIEHTGFAPSVGLCRYTLLRPTPKGYWIVPKDASWYLEERKRWIPKDSRKRYAYPTKREALIGYIARTSRYVSILNNNLYNADRGLKQAMRMKEALDRGEEI